MASQLYLRVFNFHKAAFSTNQSARSLRANSPFGGYREK